MDLRTRADYASKGRLDGVRARNVPGCARHEFMIPKFRGNWVSLSTRGYSRVIEKDVHYKQQQAGPQQTIMPVSLKSVVEGLSNSAGNL